MKTRFNFWVQCNAGSEEHSGIWPGLCLVYSSLIHCKGNGLFFSLFGDIRIGDHKRVLSFLSQLRARYIACRSRKRKILSVKVHGRSQCLYWVEHLDLESSLDEKLISSFLFCPDLVAIPDFEAGAMENWGLITFREETLLYDNASSSVADRKLVTKIIAHELAHQVLSTSAITPKALEF